MNEEQLLSYINHQLSQVAHLTALRDVVAIVVEAKQRVEEAEKRVTEADKQLQQLKESMASVEAEAMSKLRIRQREVEAEEAASKARGEACIKAAMEQLESLAVEKAELEDEIVDFEKDVKELQAEVDKLRVLKSDLQADVQVVRNQLRDIKESIR